MQESWGAGPRRCSLWFRPQTRGPDPFLLLFRIRDSLATSRTWSLTSRLGLHQPVGMVSVSVGRGQEITRQDLLAKAASGDGTQREFPPGLCASSQFTRSVGVGLTGRASRAGKEQHAARRQLNYFHG